MSEPPPDRPQLSARPRAAVAIVTCMDARIDPLAALGYELGDAHVIRNAGARVTADVVRSLSASQRLLGTTEVALMMHRSCGLQSITEPEFASLLRDDGIAEPIELGAFSDLEATLNAGLETLRSAPELTSRGAIRGFIFDPADGSVVEVAPQ